jgi:toxin-antitoxin system PIN domain toxin
MKYLVDANVVFPLLLSRHPHRQAALTWLDSVRSGEGGLCRLVQLAVLRLLCNRTVMGPDVQRPVEAWRALRSLQLDERFVFAPEPENMDVNLRAMVEGREATPNVWSDAYLAAFALSEGLSLVSFDGGMKSFPHVETLLLQLPAR